MPDLSKLDVHFWIGLVVYVAVVITAGTVSLTNAIPADWIPGVVAWNKIVAVIGNGYVLAALGYHQVTGASS